MNKVWNIYPTNETSLLCYIWDTHEEMQQHLLDIKNGDKPPEYLKSCNAASVTPKWKFKRNGFKKTLITNRLGELHFVNGSFDEGTVAHEIQHFIEHWVNRMKWRQMQWEKKSEKYSELISRLVEKLTREFWKEAKQ